MNPSASPCVLSLVCFLASACALDGPRQDSANPTAAPRGKADTTGSCEGGCGGQSSDGCWCDDQCAGFGDCCRDKVELCDAPPPQPSMDEPCPVTTVGADGTAVCEEAFETAPFIRLPEDYEEGGARFVHGGIEKGSGRGLFFVGRGTRVPIPQPLPAWLDAESMFGNVRYGYHLYRATVRGETIEDIVPVLRIDDRIPQRLLAGMVLEGMMSPRTVVGGSVRFAFNDKRVAVRIRLDDAPAEDSPEDSFTGFPRYALFGLVENAQRAVTGADGSCLPALESLGDENPLATATGDGDRVKLLRHPNMHGFHDDVFTFEWPAGTVPSGNNMGLGLFITTASLVQDAAPMPTDATNSPHGVPWGGPSASLQVVSGGGEACTP